MLHPYLNPDDVDRNAEVQAVVAAAPSAEPSVVVPSTDTPAAGVVPGIGVPGAVPMLPMPLLGQPAYVVIAQMPVAAPSCPVHSVPEQAAVQPVPPSSTESRSHRHESMLLFGLVVVVFGFLGWLVRAGTVDLVEGGMILVGIVAALAAIVFRKQVLPTAGKVAGISVIGIAVGVIALASVVKGAAEAMIGAATTVKTMVNGAQAAQSAALGDPTSGAAGPVDGGGVEAQE